MKAVLTLLIATTYVAAKLNAGTLNTLHNFGTPLFNTGTTPVASLVAGPDGTFYGTDFNGGTQNYGVVYSFKPGVGSFALKNFANQGDGYFPASELVLSGNTLYGTTLGGTIFRLNTDGTGFATLYTFTNGLDGSQPQAGLVLGGNVLYGTASTGGAAYTGTIYKINTDGSGFAPLRSFTALDPTAYTNADGIIPMGTLVLNGNTLFGTASAGGGAQGGTVFSILTDGSGFQTLHSFDVTNGYRSYTGLVLNGDTLYGDTYYGGAGYNGVIFSIRTNGSGFTNLHALSADGSEGANPECRLVLMGNTLFGDASAGGTNGEGTIFALDTGGSNFDVLYTFSAVDTNGLNDDGAVPSAGLLVNQNVLYGTASAGGYSGFGTIFQINTNGTGFSDDNSFTGPTTIIDGESPVASLVWGGNTLYGMTVYGGLVGLGTVFKVNSDGTGFTDLYSFSGHDGDDPGGPLLLAGNTLYGTTSSGGSRYDGNVFSIQTDGTGFTNLYSFTDGDDGATPMAGLVLCGSLLYGTTSAGGSNGYGNIFAISTNGGSLTVLHSFAFSEGTQPQAGLILAGGTLYGEAFHGGNGNGTLFKIQTDGTGFGLLRSFSFISGEGAAAEGANPSGGFVLNGDTLYGTTYFGGLNRTGNIFKIGTNGMGYASLFSFDPLQFGTAVINATGANPQWGLFLYGNTLYGTAELGGNFGYGTLFEINTNANGVSGLTNLWTFSGGTMGGSPNGGVTLGGGALLGTTSLGGNYNDGTVFSFYLVPPLLAGLAGHAPVIYWQDDGQNHTLQTTANLASGHWTNAPPLNWTNAPYLGLQVTNNPSLPAAFFRLLQ